MKNILLILIASIGIVQLQAQVNTDHWMYNALHWKSYHRLADQFVITDHLTDARSIPAEATSTNLLNYHAVATNPIAFEQTMADLSQLTLFVVYWSQDSTQEQLIWSIANQEKDQLLSTTERLANLEEYRFLNYLDQEKAKPKIQTYFQNESSMHSTTLKLGAVPLNQAIPVQPFNGIIAEWILFEQVLPPAQRQQIQTYLALKYGIPLSENYIAPNGQVLKAVEQSDFNYRIAGLGKNDLFGLNQKQATSSNTDIFLALGLQTIECTNALNPGQLDDNTYLIWSDDNQPLQFQQRQVLEVPSLERLWEMGVTGDLSEQPTELQIDQNGFELGEEEVLYLVVYEDENRQQKRYHKAHTVTEAGIAVFKNIIWDSDQSGKDYFSFAVGQSLIPNIAAELPQCANSQNGQLQLGAIGGQPPYRFQLNTAGGATIGNWELDDQMDAPTIELAVGTYQLLLTDQSGAQYAETFFFQASDAPMVDLTAQYVIADGATLTLDAEIEAPDLRYEWKNEAAQLLSQQPTLDITAAGKYELTLNRAGCQAKQWIEVLLLNEVDNITTFELSPNPSSDGVFRIVAQFDQAAPSQLHVYNVNGQLLQSQSFGTNRRIDHQDRVLESGIYFIELESRKSRQTQKLIVQRD